jgi:hypothetical protein
MEAPSRPDVAPASVSRQGARQRALSACHNPACLRWRVRPIRRWYQARSPEFSQKSCAARKVTRAFREAFPWRVALTPEECLSDELVECLRDGRMNAAFVRTSVVDPNGLVIYPFCSRNGWATSAQGQKAKNMWSGLHPKADFGGSTGDVPDVPGGDILSAAPCHLPDTKASSLPLNSHDNLPNGSHAYGARIKKGQRETGP